MSGHAEKPVAAEVMQIARRSMLHVFRQPAQLVAAIVFPLFLLAVTVSDLHRVSALPHFPTHSYLSFALAFVFVQAALYIVVSAGTDLAQDIQSGFAARLALTRIRRSTLILGLLAGPVAMVLVEALIYLLVGVVGGVHTAAGLPGVLAIVAMSMLMGVAFGSIGFCLALRTGSAESVQAVLPLLFAALFLSSMSLPRSLIHTRWFHDVASVNPVSYLVEAIRSLIITGWDAKALALGFGICGLTAALGLTLAAVSIEGRLRASGDRTRLFAVAAAVAWRASRNYLRDPKLLLPSIVFPLFFFAAFAGGLATIGNAPGFDFPAGYTTFQFVYVLLQAVIYGGVFTGVTIAMDLQSGFTRRLLVAAPQRMGVVLGYVAFGVLRGLVPATALVIAALAAGMHISGPAAAQTTSAGAAQTAARAARPGPRLDLDAAPVPASFHAPPRGASSTARPATLSAATRDQAAAGEPSPLLRPVAAVSIRRADGIDLLGLAALALLANVIASLGGLGLAMRIRSAEAAPLLQMLMFLVLFLSPVYVPLGLVSGWIHGVASVNPVTALLEAGRGLITGQPTLIVTAFAAAAALVALFFAYARRGLLQVERNA